jgi:hypothetical protein
MDSFCLKATDIHASESSLQTGLEEFKIDLKTYTVTY